MNLKRLFNKKYHLDDLTINILLSNLEYKISNRIQVYRVFDELGFQARKRCDLLLDLLEENKYIKRINEKNAELTIRGTIVKDIGGWLKYQDYKIKKNKPKKDWYKIISIIVSVLALGLGYMNYDLKKNSDLKTDNINTLNNENLILKKKIDSLYKVQQTTKQYKELKDTLQE